MDSVIANFILVVHFIWAVWMISGIALAFLGFRWPHLWEWKTFRTAHLIGLVATATTPFWPGGTCPLTIWEWKLRGGGTAEPHSFIIHWLDKLLFWDVDPLILSLISALGALATVAIYFLRPPWRKYRTSP